MSRIVIPGAPPPKPAVVFCQEVASREFKRMFQQKSAWDRWARLESLRASMPRERK